MWVYNLGVSSATLELRYSARPLPDTRQVSVLKETKHPISHPAVCFLREPEPVRFCETLAHKMPHCWARGSRFSKRGSCAKPYRIQSRERRNRARQYLGNYRTNGLYPRKSETTRLGQLFIGNTKSWRVAESKIDAINGNSMLGMIFELVF